VGARTLREEAKVPKTAVIIGAGPAGLTAALELLRRTRVKPIVLEASGEIGGISRTVKHNGNRMDIGGHRFFSKSDRVMNWWLELMPIENWASGAGTVISYHNRQRVLPDNPANGAGDRVMLVRPRKSRIYYLRSFFDYPITLTPDTVRKLGVLRTSRVAASYFASRINPRAPERNLEDFFINRFGRELYLTFFKSYTEKVWGVPCEEISAEWGAQRIKGLSLSRAAAHFFKTMLPKGDKGVSQKTTETSLIEQFLYPKYGPGQLWEYVAELVDQKGGEVLTSWRVVRIYTRDNLVTGLDAVNSEGQKRHFSADLIFSTMPIRDLVEALDATVPEQVNSVSQGLMYRDFITVGLLVNRLLVREDDGSLLRDTWIYIQEPDVLVGRLQIFNNWSPYLVHDPSKVWIGLEYFCYETDELWNMANADIIKFAISEVAKIGILRAEDVLDGHVVRVPKTYPAYFGSYAKFATIRGYVDLFENLFLVGRNGMHKYNNQDHSMLTAMTAVDNLVAGIKDKSNLWDINTEEEYHEEKKSD
jgi:protoporphyrinogen oxidase